MRKTHSPLGAALSAAVLAPVVAIPLAALHISPADAQAIVIAPAAPPRVEPPPRAGYACDPRRWHRGLCLGDGPLAAGPRGLSLDTASMGAARADLA